MRPFLRWVGWILAGSSRLRLMQLAAWFKF
jgi:hypothetical protein